MANKNSFGVPHVRTYDEFREREAFKDPYIKKEGLQEPSICTKCGAVYYKKRWTLDLKTKEKFSEKKFHKTLCPADAKIKDRYFMGVVNISGSLLSDYKQQIMKTIYNEEERAKTKDPLERIVSLMDNKDSIRIETTTDSLALRIGRILSDSFKNEKNPAEYKFRYGDKYVEVDWIYDRKEKVNGRQKKAY